MERTSLGGGIRQPGPLKQVSQQNSILNFDVGVMPSSNRASVTTGSATTFHFPMYEASKLQLTSKKLRRVLIGLCKLFSQDPYVPHTEKIKPLWIKQYSRWNSTRARQAIVKVFSFFSQIDYPIIHLTRRAYFCTTKTSASGVHHRKFSTQRKYYLFLERCFRNSSQRHHLSTLCKMCENRHTRGQVEKTHSQNTEKEAPRIETDTSWPSNRNLYPSRQVWKGNSKSQKVPQNGAILAAPTGCFSMV